MTQFGLGAGGVGPTVGNREVEGQTSGRIGSPPYPSPICERMHKEMYLQTLEEYPLTLLCLKEYIFWIEAHPEVDTSDNELCITLRKKEHDRLARLESLLVQARDTLNLDSKEFQKRFFTNDLLSQDAEKVHEVLAEPLLVVKLTGHDFKKIKKLPRFIKAAGCRLPAADFVAERLGKKYAIELKTIRMENKPKPQPGKPTGNAMIPYWWGKMFVSNAITKIEDKKQKAITQLVSTKLHYHCDCTMLVLYNRRLGPSALMTQNDYLEEITAIKERYDQIDHIFLYDYYGQIVIFPQLPKGVKGTLLLVLLISLEEGGQRMAAGSDIST